MAPNILVSIAVIVFSTTFIPNALAAQNAGNNWPSRTCGCSTTGKCHIQSAQEGHKCVPDGDAGNACAGVCSFTNHPADPVGGVIMRPKASDGGNGGVLQSVPN